MPARSIESICFAIAAGVSRSFLNQNSDPTAQVRVSDKNRAEFHN